MLNLVFEIVLCLTSVLYMLVFQWYEHSPIICQKSLRECIGLIHTQPKSHCFSSTVLSDPLPANIRFRNAPSKGEVTHSCMTQDSPQPTAFGNKLAFWFRSFCPSLAIKMVVILELFHFSQGPYVSEPSFGLHQHMYDENVHWHLTKISIGWLGVTLESWDPTFFENPLSQNFWEGLSSNLCFLGFQKRVEYIVQQLYTICSQDTWNLGTKTQLSSFILGPARFAFAMVLLSITQAKRFDDTNRSCWTFHWAVQRLPSRFFQLVQSRLLQIDS